MTTRRQEDIARTTQQTAAEAADTIKESTRSFKDFLTKFHRDWSVHLAQALAFSLISAIVPIIMLLLAIVGGILGRLNPHARDQLIGYVSKALLPPLSSKEVLLSASAKLTTASGLLAFIAIISAIFLGTRLFTLLEVCFDIIYRLDPRPFKNKNIMATIMLFMFVVLIPFLVLASLIPEQAIAFLRNIPITSNPSLLFRFAGIISSLLVSLLLFEAIYVFVPNRRDPLKRRVRTSWRGALTATVTLQICLILFPVYITYFMKGYAGQLAFVLILLAFFYLMSIVILIGAEVNAFFAEGIRPTAHNLITRASRSS